MNGRRLMLVPAGQNARSRRMARSRWRTGTNDVPTNRYRGPPMALANMRANGVRSLSVTCELCHHEAVMNVDAFDDAVPGSRVWSPDGIRSAGPQAGA
jgi:hypothetical protein